jgi:hypothetical protein
MAVPAIVVAFQVKRLQLWWEKVDAKWRVQQQEKKEKQESELQGN